MGGIIVGWLIIFVAVLLAASIMPDRLYFARWLDAALFAAVLGLLNALLRPVLSLFAFPITVITFGLFALVVNGFVFWLAAQLVSGMGVGSFFDAILAAIVVSIISAVVNRIF